MDGSAQEGGRQVSDKLVVREPVAVFSAVTAALQATVALLAFLGVPSEVVAGLQTVVVAWVGVAAAVVRGRVSPVKEGP